MKTVSSFGFAEVLAFLIPGSVVLYSFSIENEVLRQLLDMSLAATSGFGVELALVLLSMACGVIVSAIRGSLLDNLQFKTGIDSGALDYSKLKDEHTLNAFNAAIGNTYRFAQFYGNMAIAIIVYSVFEFFHSGMSSLHFVHFSLFVILFWSHRSELANTYTTIGQLLK